MSTEVDRWRRLDPEFDRQYIEIAKDLSRPIVAKPQKDSIPEHANWRLKFAEELYRTGDRIAAAAVTPYPWETIYRKLLQSDVRAFDKDLHEIVQVVQMKLCSEAESRIVSAMRDPELAPKDVAWIGFKWLERQDPTRWGKQVELVHTGTVKHEHTQPAALPREQRLAALVAEQKQFMLPAVTESTPVELDVIDVEAELVPVETVR